MGFDDDKKINWKMSSTAISYIPSMLIEIALATESPLQKLLSIIESQ